jgi:hypothetical protein
VAAAMPANDALLDSLIRNQRQAIRYYFAFALAMVALGVSVATVAYFSANWLNSESFKSIFALGGTFISSLSAFPLKEIIARREKLGVLLMIKDERLSLANSVEPADLIGRERIEQLVWQVVEKAAVG